MCQIFIDGESNFLTTSTNIQFTLKSPPLCCCFPFKQSAMTKSKFLFIKFLIMQMQISHIGIFLVLNMIYIESIDAFDAVIKEFIPFIAVTVLGGVWGFNLLIRTISPKYQQLKLLQKYFCFQLVLFFCKILPLLLNEIMKQLITTCDGPFTVIVKRHTIIQMLVQLEMFLLSIWAMFLYKDPYPKKKIEDADGCAVNQV